MELRFNLIQDDLILKLVTIISVMTLSQIMSYKQVPGGKNLFFFFSFLVGEGRDAAQPTIIHIRNINDGTKINAYIIKIFREETDLFH